MTEFIGLSYFAEIPAVIMNVQRAAPRPACRPAPSSAISFPAPTPRTATPSMCCCFPKTLQKASRWRRSASISPTAADHDLPDARPRHRHEPPLCRPLKWDDSKQYDRGKVMTAEMLDDGRDFGRYLDVDGDGIPFRTYPGTHPTKGSFFTRGTSRDRYARYTEEGSAYADNMQRLLRKFETAKDLCPVRSRPTRRSRRNTA